MAKLKIRRAKSTDAASLTRVFVEAYAEFQNSISDLPDVSEGLDRDIIDHNVFVATLDHDLVGGLVLIEKGSYAVLANVAVHPRAAGKGIGRSLIETAETCCHNQDIREIRLTTHIAMSSNIQLYQHMGWKKYDQSGNKIHMTKPVKLTAG